MKTWRIVFVLILVVTLFGTTSPAYAGDGREPREPRETREIGCTLNIKVESEADWIDIGGAEYETSVKYRIAKNSMPVMLGPGGYEDFSVDKSGYGFIGTDYFGTIVIGDTYGELVTIGIGEVDPAWSAVLLDGGAMMTAGHDQDWWYYPDWKNPAPVLYMRRMGHSLQVSPNGRFIAFVNVEGKLAIHDLMTRQTRVTKYDAQDVVEWSVEGLVFNDGTAPSYAKDYPEFDYYKFLDFRTFFYDQYTHYPTHFVYYKRGCGQLAKEADKKIAGWFYGYKDFYTPRDPIQH